MEQPNQENIRALGKKEGYKYLGIMEYDTIKQSEMNEKIKKQYLGSKTILQEPYQNLPLVKYM